MVEDQRQFGSIIPRFLRLKDTPGYLGLDKNVFNASVRPELTEIRYGRAVLFDRLELDAWADYTRSRCGRPPKRRANWHKEERQGFANAVVSGTSRSRSKSTGPSMRVLARQILEKRNAT